MTTLCLCDWVETQAERAGRLANASRALGQANATEGPGVDNAASGLPQLIRLPFRPAALSPTSEPRP